MTMSRVSRWTFAVVGLLLACAVGVLFLREGDPRDAVPASTVERLGVRHEDGKTAVHLEGRAAPAPPEGEGPAGQGRGVGSGEEPPDAETADEGAPDEAPDARDAEDASPTEMRRVRLLAAGGEPIRSAMLELTVVHGDEERAVHHRVDRDGFVSFPVPEGVVVRLTVKRGSGGIVQDIVAAEDAGGLDLGVLDVITLEDQLMITVRTVDPWRVPRPSQRILYTPAREDEPVTGWWGSTSDGEGRATIGPFPRGSFLDIRRGPRGDTPEEIQDPDTWTRVLVDGSEVEIEVGTAPRLRLRFPGVDPDVEIPIAILDGATGRAAFPPSRHRPGRGDWLAPALADGHVYEVLAGPLPDGRIARISPVYLTGAPIEVRWEPGIPVEGRVTTSRPGMLGGSVRVVGSAFHAEAVVDETGAFHFPGVPEGEMVYFAAVGVAEGRQLVGIVSASVGRYVTIPVEEALQVQGMLLESLGDKLRPLSGAARLRAIHKDHPRLDQELGLTTDGFDVQLPRGPWRLEAFAPDTRLVGRLDLGSLEADQKDLTLVLHAPR